jgi:hypothetical protein
VIREAEILKVTAPETLDCYINRAMVLVVLGQVEKATADLKIILAEFSLAEFS